MPRPPELSEDLYLDWKDEYKSDDSELSDDIFIAAGSRGKVTVLDVPSLSVDDVNEYIEIGKEVISEMFVAAKWLCKELRDRNVPKDRIDDLMGAHGQIVVPARDPWEVAKFLIKSETEGGEKFHAGEELSNKLISNSIKGLPPGGWVIVVENGKSVLKLV